MFEKEVYGLVANHIGNKYIRKGSKAYITWLNHGNHAESIQIWTRSKSGRAIVVFVRKEQLCHIRTAWIPEHIRTYNKTIYAWFETKEEAQQACEFYFDKEKGVPFNGH